MVMLKSRCPLHRTLRQSVFCYDHPSRHAHTSTETNDRCRETNTVRHRDTTEADGRKTDTVEGRRKGICTERNIQTGEDRQAKTDRLTKRQERGRETNIEEMADKETVEHRSKDSHKEEEI